MTRVCKICGGDFTPTGKGAGKAVTCPLPKDCQEVNKKNLRIARRQRIRAENPAPEAGSYENLDPKTKEMLEVVKKILAEETDEDGTRVISIRSIMYKLISNVFGETYIKSTRDMQKVYNHVKGARKRGDEGFEDDRFNDAKRVKDENQGWSSFEDYVATIRDAYRCDPWKTQDCLPMILVEKNTVADAIRSVTRKYKVPLFISQGYFSRSFLCLIARRIEQAQDAGNLVAVGYIGDHDPSGWNIEASVQAGNREAFDDHRMNHGLKELLKENYLFPSYWKRLAVTTKQFEDMDDDLRVDVKEVERDENGTLVRGDTRCDAYVRRFRTNRAAEVEALSSATLRDLVERFILLYRDDTAWDAAMAKEQADLARLSGLNLNE